MNLNELPSLTLGGEDVPAPTFDPRAYRDTPTGELVIKDPETGGSTPLVITLAGPEHPDRKRRFFNRQRRIRTLVSKTGKMPVVDPEEEAAVEVDELVACTLGWRGYPRPYSAAEARALYSDPELAWLRDQVKAALAERELFIRRSAPN